MSNTPTSPSHVRVGGKPFYISDVCSTCAARLVLVDSLANPPLRRTDWWEDEFVCPLCGEENGIYLDVPRDEW